MLLERVFKILLGGYNNFKIKNKLLVFFIKRSFIVEYERPFVTRENATSFTTRYRKWWNTIQNFEVTCAGAITATTSTSVLSVYPNVMYLANSGDHFHKLLRQT